MASFWNRLFPSPAVPAVKAVTGPGVVAWDYNPQLSSLSRSPQKMAREAQAIYHSNPWAYLAENTVSGTGADVAFHVEDANGTTVPLTHPALIPLSRPNPGMKRRWLWQLTLRHGGMCGDAFWYQDALSRATGIPLGFIYINPARMWDAKDKAGNLIGWVMDADRPDGRQPVGFEPEEILHFVYDPQDEGHRGVGIVEAAYNKLRLSELGDLHAAKSIASGGRKPGIISPVEGKTFNEDEYQAIVRELRNVTDSPDAAKKSLIFKSPVDYKDAGTTPSQMQLADLLRLGRDDTLALWKVPPSQVGVTVGRGLNSGDTQKYEEAALWQNAIEPRTGMLVETLQSDYLDRFGFTLILQLPTFDDQAPLYALANQAQVLPLTNNQRLALVGLPPIADEAIGSAIFLPSTLVQIGMSAQTDNDEDIQAGGEVKAKLSFAAIRDRLEREHLPKLRSAAAAVLDKQRTDIKARVAKSHAQLVRKPSGYDVWWNEEREDKRLADALLPLAALLAAEVGSKTSATFFAPVKASPFIEKVIAFVRQQTGVRIKGINATTRDDVRKVVEQGVRDGLSPADLGDRIEEMGAFAESRAELIGRTETALAYNDAALSTYRAFEVEQVQAIDGDMDAECAARNGNVYSIEEASGISDHPNGTLDWVPIVKARVEEPAQVLTFPAVNFTLPPIEIPPTVVNMPAPIVNVSVPEQKAPVVNVAAAEVTVPPTVVNVEAPVVNIPEAKAALPAEIRIVALPDRAHKLIRNKKGEATGSVETDI